MSDKELLRLAAKAAGYDYHDGGGYIEFRGMLRNWNPLTDDGDAFRLAVHLSISVIVNKSSVSAVSEECSFTEHMGLQMGAYSATRRAIVRAAAYVGVAQA